MLNWLKGEQFLVLDTETTGLDNNAQIVELGLIDQNGKKLIDTLVKPTIQIPDEAIAIHGITTEQAMDEGVDWSEVNEQLFEILISPFERKDLVIYNADYDVRLINQTSLLHDDNSVFDMLHLPHVTCAMLAYAEYWGEKSTRSFHHGGFAFQSLLFACKQQGVSYSKNAHRALADCQMTLDLLKTVWAK